MARDHAVGTGETSTERLAGIPTISFDRGRLSLRAAGTTLAAGSPGGFGEAQAAACDFADPTAADIAEMTGSREVDTAAERAEVVALDYKVRLICA